MNPKVSVVIPTYNRARFVTKAINSVLAQTYRDFEIIVVDNGSTDDTKSAVQSYGSRVRYIRQTHCGVSSARNLGVTKARGKWMAFLDSDDEWMPQKLEVQMAQVEQRPDLCAHLTNMVLNSSKGQKRELFSIRGFSDSPTKTVVLERPLITALKYQFASPCCLLAEREALISTGLFDSRLTIYEDLDLAYRLALQGPWGISSLPLVNVYRRDEPPIDLSRQHRVDRIYSCESLVSIYSKLRRDARLNKAERREISRALSGARFSLGAEQLRMGRTGEARTSFQRAFRDHSSLRTAVKYLLSILPWAVGVDALEGWSAFRGRGFRRSEDTAAGRD